MVIIMITGDLPGMSVTADKSGRGHGPIGGKSGS